MGRRRAGEGRSGYNQGHARRTAHIHLADLAEREPAFPEAAAGLAWIGCAASHSEEEYVRSEALRARLAALGLATVASYGIHPQAVGLGHGPDIRAGRRRGPPRRRRRGGLRLLRRQAREGSGTRRTSARNAPPSSSSSAWPKARPPPPPPPAQGHGPGPSSTRPGSSACLRRSSIPTRARLGEAEGASWGAA